MKVLYIYVQYVGFSGRLISIESSQKGPIMQVLVLLTTEAMTRFIV